MSTEENKEVFRRFMTEVLADGNIGAIDELLAPNYANPSVGVTNPEGFKAVVAGLKASLPTREFEIMDWVAEGDSVVLRGNMSVALASGKKVIARIIIFYRLAGGLLVEDEPISAPPLTELIGGMASPK